jgi:hypothetical protein
MPLTWWEGQMLQRYIEPIPFKGDSTPKTLFNLVNRGWIDRVGWAEGNYPIYQTTLQGLDKLREIEEP